MKNIVIDSLTQLPNRFALIEYLQKKEEVNLFLVDIDNFSNINSAYGFECGDALLIETARLLERAKPSSSKLFRINSDEFVIVVSGKREDKKSAEIASAMISFFDHSEIELPNGVEIKVGISIGIANGRGKEILNFAKDAIEELREYKRASFQIYDPASSFVKKQEQNAYWINKLKQAFEDEKLITYYQPIMDNKDKKIKNYECLIRIDDEGILTPPIRFMEASKLTGTLALVTRTVITQSFEKFCTTPYHFSINITNTDLYLNYLQNYLLRYAEIYDIHPSRVTLEILEDIDTLNTKEILAQLHSLRSHGFKISIDDFGNKSSNFSRVLEFLPDYIKIDGAFIKNILQEPKSLIIVEAVLLLCKKSNIEVIAEYVHSKEVQEKVEELGIEYSQGYYIGKPREGLL